eukprot:5658672-Amphidinium_carterae.1
MPKTIATSKRAASVVGLGDAGTTVKVARTKSKAAPKPAAAAPLLWCFFQGPQISTISKLGCQKHLNTTSLSKGILEDVDWASKGSLKDNPGVLVPVDDKCLGCHKQWQQAFQVYSWEDLCQTLKRDASLKASWDEAAVLMADTSKRTFEASSVNTAKTFNLEVNRQFLCLSMKDLKRVTGQSKLNKATLQYIPQVTLPDMCSEDGEQTFYIFRDPEKPYRSLNIKMNQTFNQVTTNMEAAQQVWKQQGQHMHETIAQKCMTETGVENLLEKLTYLKSVEEFVDEKVLKGLDGEN